MVANPEVARQNGEKSRGPISGGKAIASQNATKHGMLAQQLPLLATEELEAFRELCKG